MLKGFGIASLTCALLLPAGFTARGGELVDLDGDGVPEASAERLLVIMKDDSDVDPSQRSSPKARQARGQDFAQRVRGRHGIRSVKELGANRVARKGKRKHRVFRINVDDRQTSVAEEIERLEADNDVLVVEPDFIESSQTNDPYFSTSGAWGQSYQDQWYLEAIGAPDGWTQVPASSPEVLVAVIDSGVDRSHPDLASVVWTNTGEIDGNGIDDDRNGFIDDRYGWNFASSNKDSSDSHGHGTLIAGLIAAEHDNSIGIAGAAHGVRIMALRNGESGRSYVSDSVAAVYYAVDQGARVINMSFGGANHSRSFAEAVRYAQDHGVVMVASSGNSGTESTSHYPSGYPGVISVGASDHTDTVAAFSNYGTSVDLVAPGGGGIAFSGRTMLGCRATGTSLGDPVDGLHVRSSGTSFSAPLVAATAAMMLRINDELQPAEVRQILLQSADDIGPNGWDLKSSNGRLNMAEALTSPVAAVAEISGIPNGQVVSGTISIFGTATAPGFSSFELSLGAGKEPLDWSPISSGTVPVVGGQLGTWHTSVSEVGNHVLRLVTFADEEPVGETRISVFVGKRAPNSRPGWPVLGLVNVGSPTVMDLDGDDSREIIVPTSTGIKIYNDDGSQFRDTTYTGSLVWPAGPASVGDIDGDGEAEFGLISKSGTSSVYPEHREVRFWNLDGTTCSGWPLETPRPNNFVPSSLAPTVIDVDDDGVAEVLFPSVDVKGGNPTLHLVRGDGSAMTGWPKTLSGSHGSYIHCTTGVADLNGDGSLDFVVADSSGRIHVLDLTGNYVSGWPKTVHSGSHIFQEIALSDLDRDGRTDIIAGFYDGVVVVMDHLGNIKSGWPQDLGGIARPPAIADLDGDGDLELAIGTQDGKVQVLHHTGLSLTGWPKEGPSRFYSPSLVDLNNDGKLDIIASDGARTIHGWSSDGTAFDSLGFPFQLPGRFGCYSPPIAEDLDSNGLLEVIVVGDDLEVRDLAALANPSVLPFSHMHVNAANTCRYILPGQFSKGQQFIVDRTGGSNLDLNGSGFLAGSSVRIGSASASVNSLSSDSINVSTGAGLETGWNDLWVSHPDSGETWLANAVLVVEDLHGDTDGDELPDGWEWRHGFDPLTKVATDSDQGTLGDFDKDGLVNAVEAGFEAMGLNPKVADAHLLPQIRIENGMITADYRRNRNSRMRIALSTSSDLGNWLLPGDLGYPSDYEDSTEGPGSIDEEDRRIEMSVPNIAPGAGFIRWWVEGPLPPAE